MKIVVQGDSHGYSFVVEKTKDFETADDVVKICLQLEQELLTEENEKEDK